jgi:hypothetical protein
MNVPGSIGSFMRYNDADLQHLTFEKLKQDFKRKQDIRDQKFVDRVTVFLSGRKKCTAADRVILNIDPNSPQIQIIMSEYTELGSN